MSENAAVFGGGICSGASNVLALVGSTVAGNSATISGGGIYNAGLASMINTIIVANPALSENSDCGGGAITSLGHNLMVPWGGCVPNAPAGDLLISSRVTVNSFFDPTLADNGGPTPTHAVAELGFAVDAGICANGETTDQRGLPRPYDRALTPNAADGCDIGAFEWQPPSALQLFPYRETLDFLD